MSEWIAVADRVPEPYQAVLVWGPTMDRVYISNMIRDENEYDGPVSWRLFFVSDVTHWMPLPEVPNA